MWARVLLWVGSTTPSSRPHTTFSHDSLEGTGDTHADDIMAANPLPSRENPSEPVADFHSPQKDYASPDKDFATDILLSVESHDTFSIGYVASILLS